MANQYENWILTINKWAWIVSLALGVIWLIAGIVAASLLATAQLNCGVNPLCLALYGTSPAIVAWWFIVAILAMVAGIMGFMKVVKPINEKNFDTVSKMLLIVAIIGVIADGAGFLFLIQFILIKFGEK